MECLEIAQDIIAEVDHQYTPVYLGSTAGMRLVRYQLYYYRDCAVPYLSYFHTGYSMHI